MPFLRINLPAKFLPTLPPERSLPLTVMAATGTYNWQECERERRGDLKCNCETIIFNFPYGKGKVLGIKKSAMGE